MSGNMRREEKRDNQVRDQKKIKKEKIGREEKAKVVKRGKGLT